MKYLKISLLVLLFVSLHLLFLSSCALQFRKAEKEYNEKYASQSDSICFGSCQLAERTIHYAYNGNPNSDTVLFFVHGSPGAWDAFEFYVQNKNLRNRFQIISVDRPGYGYSDFGKKEESLNMQSWVYAPILKPLVEQGKTIILIGHSYGGPVIAKMAMDYGKAISGLIFIAPSLDPDLEPFYWVQEPATWPLFRWMIPRTFVVSNEEIIALKPQLEKIKPKYESVRLPIIFVQGGKDKLVHPDNRIYAEKMFKNAEFEQWYYPELDHFIPFMQTEIVLQAIDSMSLSLRR